NLADVSKTFNRASTVRPERYPVSGGDLLVSWSETLGIFEWHDHEDAWLNHHIFKVVPVTGSVHKPYLRHAIERSIASMTRYTHGSTMKHINRKDFLDTKVY